MKLKKLLPLTILLVFFTNTSSPQTANTNPAAQIVGEIVANGQQLKYLTHLSDNIGSRLTGSAGARRAEEEMFHEMNRLGLTNVRRESFAMPSSWERVSANASLTEFPGRALTIASYTWAPGTSSPAQGEVVDVAQGRPEDLARAKARLKNNIALVVFEGETLDALIYKFYRTPVLVRELKEAGTVAVMIASDKQHAMLFTSPVDFTASGKIAALPTVSLAREDAFMLRRMIAAGKTPRVKLDVKNRLGPAFASTNVVGEIRGREKPDEIIVVGAHLDSNDLGPGALDNAAGSAAVMEAARAIKALNLQPRRTIRFVLFMGEEEGMIGSVAYIKQHRDELDRTIAAFIMDIGAGRPLGWFSMGRKDLDVQINEMMRPLEAFGASHIEHAAFAATDNAPFMAEGIPNLILIQDEAAYLPVHHTIGDTADKVDPRDYAAAVATLAVAAYSIADNPTRFGRRLTSDEVKKMAAETKVDEQWRAAGIWK